MPEIIAAAVGVPLTFVLGWWGRGKWERYPWNAKPQRYTIEIQPDPSAWDDLRQRLAEYVKRRGL